MSINFAANAVPEALKRFFETHSKLALAFSGGCDSAYLLYAAAACGADVTAYYVHSCFQPAFELEAARTLAQELKVKMRILPADVLADADVQSNPVNRCYFCKKLIFGRILAAAHGDGYAAVIDGTNASDDADDRPGMQALREMQVLSPLRMCGIAKAQVRALSREANLFTWNKPAYACLATRVPTDMPITAELLSKVERAENCLFEMGFSDFRVRIGERGARLEVPEAQMEAVFFRRAEILSALEGDFSEITLNLRGRRGAGE